jgi:tRNA-guanine family transglycosylase
MGALSERPLERMVWLGQSARTTIVTRLYPELAGARWMASLGDVVHRPRMAASVFAHGLRERLNVTGPIMLDSGGYTMMTRPCNLTVTDVLDIYRHTAADLLISLDHPPLAVDDEAVRAAKYRRNASNYAFLLDRLGADRLVPVLHGITLEELAANCETLRRANAGPKWICMGGLVPRLRQSGANNNTGRNVREGVGQSIALARECFSRSNLHVLGAGAPATIAAAFAYGADSVDSIGWRRAAGFGTIFLPGGSERFVAPRHRQRPRSRPALSAADLTYLSRCNCPACAHYDDLGGRLSELSHSYLARAAHNAHILMELARTARAAD